MDRNRIRAWREGCTACLLQLVPLIWIFFPQGVYPASLESSTASAWGGYSESATMRMKERLISGKTFLWVDEAPERLLRIQEIDNYGFQGQSTLPEDQGMDLVWRLFTISRYAKRDGSVYLELETVGLSRDIPGSLRWLVEPLVRRVSRQSLSTGRY